jgi:hypothetical protein
LCDWQRGYAERIRRTIHPEFTKPVKTIKDWNPKLFTTGFAELMEVQKILAIKRIRDYAYGQDYDRKTLDSNLAERRNLFIRGPSGSGRGLLLATIKLHAAIREIAVTPIPCDYDIFRADYAEAESFGQIGEEKRILIAEKYDSPQIMVVENVRATEKMVVENVRATEKIRNSVKKIKGSAAVDATVAKRLAKHGSIVITSYDFIGEILDSMGDRMLEVLTSPRTRHLLMFDPNETITLRKAVHERKKSMLERMEQIRVDDSEGRKMRTEKMGEDEQVAILEDALFFEEAFKGLKPMPGEDVLPIQAQMEMGAPNWAKRERVLKVWETFVSSRKDKDVAYNMGVQRARIEAVRSCRVMSDKMTDTEMLETGMMLSYACMIDTSTDDPKLAEWKKQAEESKDRMVSDG